MQIHARTLTSTSAGGTGDGFDVVGTPRTRKDAVQLLGFFCSAGPVTGTAAEAYLGQYRFTNNTLQISTTKTGPPAEGGAPATNIGHRMHQPYWIPCRRGSLANPIGQVDITIEFSTHLPDVAVASAVAVSTVYTAKGASVAPIPEQVIQAYRSGDPHVIPGELASDWDADSAVATTVAETSITDLVVDKNATGISGFSQGWAADGFAAEEAIGFVRYRSSIPNFEPQEWLLPGSGAPLGTAVGVGMFLEGAQADYATWFPKDKGELTTVTPNVVWVAATTTTSPTVNADVAWYVPGLA